MRRISGLLGILAIATGAYLIGATTAPALPACAQEDSVNCVWDAQQQGNGAGVSFVDIAGTAYYAH